VPRLTEDQQLLAQSAGKVLGSGGSARFRSLRDQGAHIDSPLWDQLIELGWPAIPFPEAAGGLGWGLPEVAIVMEALGRNLSLTPQPTPPAGRWWPWPGRRRSGMDWTWDTVMLR